jgi:hypothetical protein
MAGTTTKTLNGTVTSSFFAGNGTGLTNVATNVSGTANYAAIYNGVGALTAISDINPDKGGTGLNSSSNTGVPRIAGGGWTIDSTLSSPYGGTGTNTSSTTGAPYITAGTWSFPSLVSPATGGTGLNNTGNTGIAFVTGGAWSIISTLPRANGGTGRSSFTGGVPFLSSGNWDEDINYLRTALGGTGISTSSSTGVPKVSSGTWSTDTYLPAAYGGLAANYSSSSGYFFVNAGTFSISPNVLFDLSTSSIQLDSSTSVTSTDATSHSWIIKSGITRKKGTLTGSFNVSIMKVDGNTSTTTADNIVSLFYVHYVDGSTTNATNLVSYATSVMGVSANVQTGTGYVAVIYQGLVSTTLIWTITVIGTLTFDTTYT